MHSEWNVNHEEGINTKNKKCVAFIMDQLAKRLDSVLSWNFFADYLRQEFRRCWLKTETEMHNTAEAMTETTVRKSLSPWQTRR
jgi:hypothetical protein